MRILSGMRLGASIYILCFAVSQNKWAALSVFQVQDLREKGTDPPPSVCVQTLSTVLISLCHVASRSRVLKCSRTRELKETTTKILCIGTWQCMQTAKQNQLTELMPSFIWVWISQLGVRIDWLVHFPPLLCTSGLVAPKNHLIGFTNTKQHPKSHGPVLPSIAHEHHLGSWSNPNQQQCQAPPPAFLGSPVQPVLDLASSWSSSVS